MQTGATGLNGIAGRASLVLHSFKQMLVENPVLDQALCYGPGM